MSQKAVSASLNIEGMGAMKRLMIAAGLAVLASQPASATVLYLANGSLTGTTDLSGLTGTLENGLAANILGGLGSGLAYAGGNTFIAVPDRGPNAMSYNSAVDDTTSYISRFQTLTLGLTPSTGGLLPFTLSPTLTATTLLYSPTPLVYGTGAGLGNQIDGTPLGSGAPSVNTATASYFTGRSDNFASGTSGNPLNARFDPEAVRVSGDGKSVFVSDEYGPYIRQFDRASGKLLNTVTLPANLDVVNQSSQGAVEIAGNTVGRIANKGMEGLAITPDGKTLVGIMQANLEQDPVGLLRIVTVDVATGATHEFGYKLTTGSGVSDIVAINDHQFLVDERDGKGLGDGSNAKVKQFFVIDTTGAADIIALSGTAAASATSVSKSAKPFIDLVAALTAAGIPANQIPSKIEGLAFGQDVTLNGAIYHTLVVANDNDFVPATSGTNQFYVFGFQDSDLPGFVAQQFASAVPEPASWTMMIAGFAAVGFAIRRQKVTTRVSYAG